MEYIRSELVRVRHPQDENGLLYYTPISFEINNEKVEIPMKVKTGTDISIIGINSIKSESLKKFILSKEIIGETTDIFGEKIDLREHVVENLRLTDKIVIPKIRVFLSETLNIDAWLGMDVLGRYTFEYCNKKFYLIKEQKYTRQDYEAALANKLSKQFMKEIPQ